MILQQLTYRRPVTSPPKYAASIFVIDPRHVFGYVPELWTNTPSQQWLLKRGMIHTDRDNAEMHASALLSTPPANLLECYEPESLQDTNPTPEPPRSAEYAHRSDGCRYMPIREIPHMKIGQSMCDMHDWSLARLVQELDPASETEVDYNQIPVDVAEGVLRNANLLSNYLNKMLVLVQRDQHRAYFIYLYDGTSAGYLTLLNY